MFKVLHSSAGAGKTHALVKHYLLLSLHGPDPSAYSHILALTFTNKAAAEMRERVLVYLEALASEKPMDGAKADVRDSVMAEAGITAEELHRRAKAMLTHMLHHWSQVAISTIDAFTRRVVMPFSRDLQLDHELRMTTEEQYYRAKAVDLLLEEAGRDAALTKVLVATCEQLLEDESSWRPDKPLLELSAQLTKENALEHLATLREMDSEQFLELYKRLRQRTKEFRERMRKLGADACDAIERAALTDKDLANGKGGFISYLRKLRDFDGPFDMGKNVIKTLESDKWHSGSATPSAISAIENLASLFRTTIGTVEALRDTEMRDYFIVEAITHDLLATASLNSIDQRLEELKREEGVSFFSDLTRKVMAIVQDEPAPFLYERLGEKYRHFLIDEFQDTSLMQWHALLPLVENALSTGGSVLLVGDAKQAIYRWRNGEARQFVAFPKIFRKELLARGDAFESALIRAHVPVEPLASNHRSARSIITFNNDVAGRLKLELDEQERNVYDRHEQAMVREDEGYVEVSCYATGKEAEEDGPWDLMVKAVSDSLADDFRLGDIAVLVRTKAQGATASDHLAQQGWEVVSPDGLTLGANPVACAVVHVLAWLQRPVDENAALAAQSIASVRAKAETVDPFPEGQKPQELLRHWRSEHPRISARLPLVTLVCRIAEALAHDPATDVFIMGLVNEAHAFSKTGGDDLPGFLEHWDRTASGRSVGGTPGLDAIQVMTVHKAKGLQFPVVIVPEAGKSSRGGNGERIWITPEPALEGPPSALVKKVTALTDLGIPELMEEDRLTKLDQLDVLYVALTRPEQRLYVSVAGGVNDFLAKALREHLGLEAGTRWSAGMRGPRIEKERRGALPKEPAAFELSSAAPQGERELALRREAPEGWDPADPDPYRSHGRAVHAMLARVHTPADLPEAVAMESTSWGLSPDVTAAIAKQLEALLAKPELAPFFREGLEVHTESTLLNAEGHAVRPDRVVREGDVFRVLDIKTGAPSEKHADQVRAYTELLHVIEGKPVEGYLLYVSDGMLVPVEA
jgi:ATP-dependent exoDNAse (exonuclease V) beta subunit